MLVIGEEDGTKQMPKLRPQRSGEKPADRPRAGLRALLIATTLAVDFGVFEMLLRSITS